MVNWCNFSRDENFELHVFIITSAYNTIMLVSLSFQAYSLYQPISQFSYGMVFTHCMNGGSLKGPGDEAVQTLLCTL